jgi:hypothetical protein
MRRRVGCTRLRRVLCCGIVQSPFDITAHPMHEQTKLLGHRLHEQPALAALTFLLLLAEWVPC